MKTNHFVLAINKIIMLSLKNAHRYKDVLIVQIYHF